jgi:bacteriorhodopsin
MHLSVKVILWSFFFIVNIIVSTGVYAYNYISTLFHMPLDIWNELEEVYADQQDENND